MTTIVKPNPDFDYTNPPVGTRLKLGLTAALLKITISDMADATGIGRATVHRLLSNEFPARQQAGAVRAALVDLFIERGATDEQVAELFHAHGSKPSRNGATDKHGRPNGPRQPAATTTPATPQEDEPEMLLPKQALTPQAARHFKLFRNPFDGEVTTDSQFFAGDDIRYVREAAWQCAKNGGFVAVVGESGAGKTTIQADLEERLKSDPQSVIVIKPGVLGLEQSNNRGQVLKSADILHAVITTIDPAATVPQTLQARTVRATKMLNASAETGNMHLLVIEEAHSLPDATLKHLKRLHEIRQGRRSLLGILLLAQPELKVRFGAGLRSGALREVAQRCEVVELLPLDNDLGAYLACRADAVNVKLASLIDDAAITALRTRMTRKTGNGAVSMCYPLAVNNMLTKAMNEAAALGAPVVTRDVIAAV